MAVQEENQVDSNVLYTVIQKLQNDVTAKFDDLSKQVGEVRVLVLQAQAADTAHNLPGKIEGVSGRVAALELARAGEKGLPGEVEDHERRIKTIETRENERQGRRKLLDAMAVIATLLGGALAVIQLYQWLKGH